jgi:hypothetical protein
MSSNGTNGINRAFDTAVIAAEGVRQVAVAAVSSQPAINTIEITYYRAVAKAAIADGCSPSAAMAALKSLGVAGL